MAERLIELCQAKEREYRHRAKEIEKALQQAKEATLRLADVCLEPEIVCEGILEKFENLATNGRQRIVEDRMLDREEATDDAGNR